MFALALLARAAASDFDKGVVTSICLWRFLPLGISRLKVLLWSWLLYLLLLLLLVLLESSSFRLMGGIRLPVPRCVDIFGDAGIGLEETYAAFFLP